MPSGGPPLVVGVGNVFRRDDGAGIRVIQALWSAVQQGTAALPPHTAVLDGGTAGLGLLPAIATTDHLVIVDALTPAGHPGAVSVLRGRDLGAATGTGCAVDTLLATADLAGVLPREVTLVGVEAADTGDGDTLTPEVEAAIVPAVAAVVAQLAERRGRAT